MFVSFFLIILISLTNSEVCESPEGVNCNCEIINDSVKISNCHKEGGWSDWSKWSKCRSGLRKRRRKCNNPTPLGFSQFCQGASLEKQKCSDVPEHFFGSWSSWNDWTTCDCAKNQQSRSRFCQGVSCEGCDVEHRDCSKTCPDIRKWTNWSDWLIDGDGSEVRFGAFFSSQSMHIELVTQKRERLLEEVPWSNWKFTSTNIAYRFRVLSNSSIDFEHYLISRKMYSYIPLYIAILIGVVCIIFGFTIQFFVNWVFSKFKHRTNYSNYSFSGDF